MINSTIPIRNVRFYQNTQGLLIGNGSNYENEILVKNCEFIENKAAGSKGISIYAYTHALKIEKCNFIGNNDNSRAPMRSNGASLYFVGDYLHLLGNLFQENSASHDGSNLYISTVNDTNDSKITINNNRFINNIALGVGNQGYQGHNIFIDKAFRFGDIDISYNIFNIPVNASANYPSVNLYNYSYNPMPRNTNAFIYKNNTTVSANHNVRDLEINTSWYYADFPVIIENSVFTGGFLNRYLYSDSDNENNIKIRNSWFSSTEKIRGSNNSQYSSYTFPLNELTENHELFFGYDLYIDQINFQPIWNSTKKSILIDNGYSPDRDVWFEDPQYQDADGTKIDIGAVPAIKHVNFKHELNANQTKWVCFPYLDKLYSPLGTDMLQNLHFGFSNYLFNQGSTTILGAIFWQYPSVAIMLPWNNLFGLNTVQEQLDSRIGYKISMRNIPRNIYTSGFLAGTPNNSGTAIPLVTSGPSSYTTETILVGYFKEVSEDPFYALQEIIDNLLEIKTENWCYTRGGTSQPWPYISSKPKLIQGEAVQLTYVPSQKSSFEWKVNPWDFKSNDEIIRPRSFNFNTEPDYIPIYVKVSDDMVSEYGGELGFFVNDVCYGAEVIYGEDVQINAYIMETEFDDDAIVEFRYHEYDSRSLSKVLEYCTIQDNEVQTHTKGINLKNKQTSYHVTFVNDDSQNVVIPITTSLMGNYPNPFNPSTTISFSLSKAEQIKLQVYNVKGQLVKTLIDGSKESGFHNVVWNGEDNNFSKVSSGIYFYKLETSTGNEIKKMLLMK